MMKSIVILVFAMLLAIGVSAQNCKTVELQEIYTLLTGKGVDCEIRKDSAQNIVHLGTPIFRRDVKNNFSKPIVDFIERYNLYLRLLSAKDREKIILEKKLRVEPESFFKVDSLCDFSLKFDGSFYTAVWSKSGSHVCSLGFENSFPLIFGMNIKESQKYFRDELANYYDNSFDTDTEAKDVVTVAGVFSGLIKNTFVLHITQNLYNYETVEYEVDLQRFVNYCMANGCEVNIGTERIENDTVDFTVVYHNVDFGYNHLVYGSISASDLKKLSGTINVRLNTFIPTHNVKDLYNDKTD